MELYQALIQFRDSDLSPIFVKEADEDRVVTIEKVSQTYRGKSKVKLNFTQEEFESIYFNDDEYNNAKNTFNACQSNYGTLFVDDYWGDEEMKEGYILHHFNEENLELFRSIIRMVNPGLSDFDLGNPEEIGRFFYDKFQDYASDIAYEYTHRYDDALKTGCVDYVQNKMCGELTNYGFIEKECGEIYLTTLDTLIFYWDQTKTPHDGPIIDMFKNFVQQNGLEIDEDLYDDYYSYYDNKNFDDEGFQREVNRILERLKDRVVEDFEEGHLIEYQKLYDLVKKSGVRIKQWSKFPKEKGFGKELPSMFKIDDFSDGKIIVDYSKTGNFGGYNIQTMSMNFEDFKNFLYHPELF